METLKASVQYGDFEGTAAADEGSDKSLHQFLEEKGLISGGEFLVGIRAYVGENFGGKAQRPWIRALIANGEGYDNVAAQIDKADPLELTEREIDISIEEFVGLFKRFSVVLTKRGLDLTGRDYEEKKE